MAPPFSLQRHGGSARWPKFTLPDPFSAALAAAAMRGAVMEGLQPGQERLAPAGRIGARRFVLVLGRW